MHASVVACIILQCLVFQITLLVRVNIGNEKQLWIYPTTKLDDAGVISSLILFQTAPPCRIPQVGLLVLFLHDIGDIWLELSKTVIYFKFRGGKEHRGPEHVATFTFAIFTVQQ